MTRDEALERVEDILSEMEDYAVVDIWNSSNLGDDVIDMGDFADNESCEDIFDVIARAINGYWDSYADYYTNDGYGYNCGDAKDLIDIEELARDIVDNEKSFGFDSIQKILDEIKPVEIDRDTVSGAVAFLRQYIACVRATTDSPCTAVENVIAKLEEALNV